MTHIKKLAWWTALTTLGFTFGVILGLIAVSSVGSLFSIGWWWAPEGAEQPNPAAEVTNIGISFVFLRGAPIADAFIFNLFVEGAIGIMIGLFQGILVRKIGIHIYKWILWSVIGYLLPHIFYLIAAEQHIRQRWKHQFGPNSGLYVGILLMFICVLSAFMSLGFFQWLEIRKVFTRSWLWILGTSIGMSAYWYLTIFEIIPFREEMLFGIDVALFSGCFLGIFQGIAFAFLKLKNKL
jgi:hypothetical protein